ncbi:MAG: Rieske 2Fe-2S domain-containing protein [Gammaproteobacteria bacterium]|nr:Rieske 2Fe-2S domain-containing protein [Gammaproteobacteria bacterium]
MCAAVAEDRRWAKQYPWLGEEPIPTDSCISEEIYQQEIEKVFKKVWLSVGRVEELPEPGCYKLKRLDFASTSVLLIRGKDNEIRAFHNTCSHRGNTVVVPEGEWDNFGQKSAFSCRFHAWTYNDQGELIGAQDEKGMPPCFNKSENGLTPISLDIWEGFIFINLDENPKVGLKDYLGKMGDHFSGFPYDEITHCFSYYTYMDTNWKVGLDAFAEAYHVNTIHAGSFPGTFSTGLQMIKLYDDHRSTAVCFNPPKSAPPVAGLAQSKARGSLVNNVAETILPPTLNDEKRDDYAFELSVFFPNWLLHVSEGIWFTHQFWPIAQGKTLWEGKYYVKEPRTNSEKWALEHAMVVQRNAWLEDTATMEGTYYALKSGSKKFMQLHDEEILVRHGYHVLEKYLKGEEGGH